MKGQNILLPAILAALVMSTAGCVNRKPTAKPQLSTSSGISLGLVNVTRMQPMGRACEDLFTSAEKGDWYTAGRLAGVVASQANLTKTGQLPAVRQSVAQLRTAVAQKNKTAAQAQANCIYRELLSFSQPYNAAVPSSLNQLKYFCRETMLSCDKNDTTGASANARRLLACWKATDASVSNIYHVDKDQAQAAANALNRQLSAGNLKQTRSLCSQMLKKAAILEQDCVKQSG